MKFGMMFPGQGSQRLGMLADLAKLFSLVKDTFEEASAVLDYDLWALVQSDKSGNLDQSSVTQPAILTASYALWRCWQSFNPPVPTVMIGHSLGEYSALVCAEALSFADALRLVQLRGELMQRVSNEQDGMMAVVLGLEDDVVVSLCHDVAQGRMLNVANFNAPGQVVVSGERLAVKALVDKAKAIGAKRVLPLAVSVAAHSQLMAPMQSDFSLALDKIVWQMPSCTVLQNTLLARPSNINQIKQALIDQLTGSVPWVSLVRLALGQGVEVMIECGPQRVLCNLNKRIDSTLSNFSLENTVDFSNICKYLGYKFNFLNE